MSGRADDGVSSDDVELARTALARARAHARTGGRTAGRGPSAGTSASRWRVSVDPDEELRSGPGPDARDPQPMRAAIEALVSSRGWQDDVAVGALVGRWAEIVGPDVAAHVSVESVRPAALDSGEAAPGADLVLRADSTAWATQVRLLLPALRRRLDDEVGAGVISRVRVLGPAGPSWRAGPRHVAGRGPRDTYG